MVEISTLCSLPDNASRYRPLPTTTTTLTAATQVDSSVPSPPNSDDARSTSTPIREKENENTELGGRDAKNRQIIHKKHSIQSRTTPPKPPSHGTAPNHSQSRPTPIPSPFPSGILSSL
ncbi:hypothetical protein G4B88_005136 [Cannabis sativa]|uniref:Uncharacterized protein n=1 Tax=Cannabis sativa TaxID=3483 RepID=A0A7J6ESS7_CANSA|nr:hypothetical protein G4B88_005136 [Cannabis sativa]